MDKKPEGSTGQAVSSFSGFIQAAGVILAISYPVLALSTGVRAAYQLFEGDETNAPWLTLLGALLYTLATIGFAKQPQPDRVEKPVRTFLGRWWRGIPPLTGWRISVYVLAFETVMTLLVGILSYTHPDLIGRNVWQYFGRDYGYFPLVQPLLGLAWLFNRYTLEAYQVPFFTRRQPSSG